LGLLFQATGRHHEAEAAFREALKIWEETLGPDDPRVDLGYYNLAVNLFQAGRIQEAERLARKAFEIEMRTGGPRAPIPYGAATILARILYALGRSQEAEAVALDSLERIVQLSRGSQLPESLVDLIRSGYLELFQQLGTNEQRYHNQLESISAGAARS
jgi:tetratricopeptide (TPR) repeat protein